MRRGFGSSLLVVALLLVAVGCGDDEGSATDDPAPSPSQAAGDAVDFELVEAITETGVGGLLAPTAYPLDDDQTVAEFVSQFNSDTLPATVHDLVRETEVPDGQLLYGAVVGSGCDVPGEFHVMSDDGALSITASRISAPTPECAAPMTTVIVVLVPGDAVG